MTALEQIATLVGTVTKLSRQVGKLEIENVKLKEDLSIERRERQLAEEILATERQIWFQTHGSTCAGVEKVT